MLTFQGLWSPMGRFNQAIVWPIPAVLVREVHASAASILGLRALGIASSAELAHLKLLPLLLLVGLLLQLSLLSQACFACLCPPVDPEQDEAVQERCMTRQTM